MGAIAVHAAELAVVEFKDRWKRGDGDEDIPQFRDIVGEYWRALGPGYTGWENSESPWSAAFISYVLRKAGAGDQFPYSPAHSKYIILGNENFRKGDLNADVVAYEVSERRPEVGDLVIYWRGVKRWLRNLPENFTSHSDIVVSKSESGLVTIGGNLDDSVRQRSLALDEDGHLVKTSQMMGFLKLNF